MNIKIHRHEKYLEIVFEECSANAGKGNHYLVDLIDEAMKEHSISNNTKEQG